MLEKQKILLTAIKNDLFWTFASFSALLLAPLATNNFINYMLTRHITAINQTTVILICAFIAMCSLTFIFALLLSKYVAKLIKDVIKYSNINKL
ncbi:hypothetical protein [Lactobacillus ultunensis]|uniref:Uncharacterized protein n=1 Tax=Lactobacillus ultunensis DSM 16047 TaxID=525365 RepID=C2ELF1_9LACO|nr:hypothetical protein [Lactobacillus ultunensis]EEJ72599.1 hypothetical protein HMPREF0548_0497 [Lactobacillus ultunensis DSM 16047]KRL81258.1 hypothetical protein FC57_GL000789 [Lactobacillus ultunensis DSM 16047]QQP28202.1 hypothetical protein H4B44_08870 [Lactobacillus ultunensis]